MVEMTTHTMELWNRSSYWTGGFHFGDSRRADRSLIVREQIGACHRVALPLRAAPIFSAAACVMQKEVEGRGYRVYSQ